VLTIPRQAVQPGDAVVVIDDLVATGGTLVAALELIVTAMGGRCVECACVVELKALKGADRYVRGSFPRRRMGVLVTAVSLPLYPSLLSFIASDPPAVEDST
jgi:adenine/guanine phosphoribosyltransferase-like PRPP-binding protein